MREIVCDSIGEAWIKAAEHIFDSGQPITDDDQKLREFLHFVLIIKNPAEGDKIVDKYGRKDMIGWMASNYLEQEPVAELNHKISYGKRIFNYNGKDQVESIIEKLSRKPEAKSATISLMKPDKDEKYVPCICLLDFLIRDGKLTLIIMARSIDFGKKIYADLIALHKLQKRVAQGIGVPTGDLVLYCVSAHIYEENYDNIKKILEEIKDE
jgi:thymidylate synthase